MQPTSFSTLQMLFNRNPPKLAFGLLYLGSQCVKTQECSSFWEFKSQRQFHIILKISKAKKKLIGKSYIVNLLLKVLSFAIWKQTMEL